MNSELNKKLDEFISDNIENIKRDIKTLVDINSVAAAPEQGAPHGAGVRRALDAALAMAQREGMQSVDLDGQVGYSHAGPQDKYIGMMAHMDVVPQGEGWDTDPFCCTEREGYLLGRGVQDNKGSYVTSLYAMRFVRENCKLRYGQRLIAGCDEETGMTDIDYYLDRCGAPDFTIIPDATFPVGHGEKGIYTADLVSEKALSAAVIELAGGLASNVVPERAHAVVDCTLAAARAAADESFVVEGKDGQVKITAHGIAGHAGHPVGSRNAIIMLLKLLRDGKLVPEADAQVLSVIADSLDINDGSKLGIASEDGIFTPLTCIGGIIEKRADGRVCQNMNCRYPTSTCGQTITAGLCAFAASNGYTLENVEDNPPHYIPADSAPIALLMDCYNRVTGRNEKPYVMSGGTYARHIPNAVAFGGEFENEKFPDFVGTIHGKNEGISVDTVLLAIKIYANALYDLQQLDSLK